jgi:selenium donor protein
MSTTARFIDWADHSGCSQKVDGLRLESLLEGLPITEPWADAATFSTDGAVFAGSTDVVLPMINDPGLFGEIVVAHVLSDLYAIGAEPVAGLNLLAVPEYAWVDSEMLREMLSRAARKLQSENGALLGGHTIENEQLLYGLAVVGRVGQHSLGLGGCEVGDHLMLTKPLGTSIATAAWKYGGADISSHQDVVDGQLQTNRLASKLLVSFRANACTDVTGYGFAGHLHNLLRVSGVAARVRLLDLPKYASTEAVAGSIDRGSRLLEGNEDFLLGQIEWPTSAPSAAMRAYVLDSQVSGGLLAAVPSHRVTPLLAQAREEGQVMWDVGVVTPGSAGAITFV